MQSQNLNRHIFFMQLAISCATGTLFTFIRRYTIRTPNDFGWAVSTAKALVSGIDPYLGHLRDTVPYPLPVALFGLPFIWTDEITATDIFIGISITLLVLGILKSGKPWQLLILASAPLVFAAEIGQWSPLITASWFWPNIAGTLTLIKPQTALPVFLTRFRWKSLIFSGFMLILSLLLMPLWPWKWLQLSIGRYFYQIPILVPFGIILLLSLLYFHEETARLLFFSSLLPFRSVYDFASLALIPQNVWQMTAYVVFSWVYLLSRKIWGINITPIALHLLCLVFIVTNFQKKTLLLKFNLSLFHRNKNKS